MSTEWKLDPRAYVASQLEEMARDGGIARRAERDGIGYGDAMVQLAEELWRPYKEIEEKYGSTGPVELAEDSSEKPKVDDADAALDRKAEARARREGISYEAALEAVLEEM
jgi:hypothetical protein